MVWIKCKIYINHGLWIVNDHAHTEEDSQENTANTIPYRNVDCVSETAIPNLLKIL